MTQQSSQIASRKRAVPQILDVTVRNVKDFGNDTRHVEFFFKAGVRFEFTAGQFISVIYPHDGRITKRAYSIASPPSAKDHIDLCLKRVEGGSVTNWIWTFKGGEVIRIQGPLGKFALPEQIDFEPVFVATGTGIAPFRSMIHDLFEKGFAGKISLLFGARYENMIPYEGEWKELTTRHPNFSYIPTISRPSAEWKGERSYVQKLIGKYLADPKGRRIYICGLNDMIQAVKESCLAVGYKPNQIFFERYD